jgi:hypothetical protein
LNVPIGRGCAGNARGTDDQPVHQPNRDGFAVCILPDYIGFAIVVEIVRGKHNGRRDISPWGVGSRSHSLTGIAAKILKTFLHRKGIFQHWACEPVKVDIPLYRNTPLND